MPYARPPLKDLRAQAKADVQAGLPGADALLRYSNLAVMADVQAAGLNGNYGYLDWIALQSNPFTATDEALEGWAALKRIFRKPATAASGLAVFGGAPGAVVPAGTSVVRGDGALLVTAADAPVVAGLAGVAVVASAPGAAGNADAGTALTLGAAVAGINSTGTASGPLTGGADVEADDALRFRMLLAYQQPPQGGAGSDYVQWALGVPGVTRAWVAPLGMGAGTVVVYVMLDDAEAAPVGFPQGADGSAAAETRASPATGDQLAVADALYLVQPVTALVYVVAPQANSVSFTIAGISGASAAVKTAVRSAIAAVLLGQGTPGGVTLSPGMSGGTVDLSYIEAAIAAIAGTAGFVITALSCDHGAVSPGPEGNIVSATGYLPVLGATSWV